jgi:hypothetical protein
MLYIFPFTVNHLILNKEKICSVKSESILNVPLFGVLTLIKGNMMFPSLSDDYEFHRGQYNKPKT